MPGPQHITPQTLATCRGAKGERARQRLRQQRRKAAQLSSGDDDEEEVKGGGRGGGRKQKREGDQKGGAAGKRGEGSVWGTEGMSAVERLHAWRTSGIQSGLGGVLAWRGQPQQPRQKEKEKPTASKRCVIEFTFACQDALACAGGINEGIDTCHAVILASSWT